MASISNPSAANPFIVKIHPGTYTVGGALLLALHSSGAGMNIAGSKLVGPIIHEGAGALYLVNCFDGAYQPLTNQ